jgi:hypothetical protein
MKKIRTKILVVIALIIYTVSCSNDDDTVQDQDLEGQGQSLLAFTAFGNIGCGEIMITVDQLGTRTMDGEDLPMGFVQCQDTGTSVVQWDDIPSGTYNYTATCSGFTWTGSRVLGNGSCSYLALTSGSAD